VFSNSKATTSKYEHDCPRFGSHSLCSVTVKQLHPNMNMMVQDLEYIQMSAPHDMQKFGIGVGEVGGWYVINLEKPVVSVSVNYMVQCLKHFLLMCSVILR
jgi:hypothetical protein